MPERTEIEKLVRMLVASDVIYRPLKSFGERGVRRLDKTAKDVSSLLKEEEEVGERVFARIESLDEKKARGLNEGIAAFKKRHPHYGEILQELIDEKREKNNRYLTYGLQEGFKLGEEDYLRVMMNLGFDRRDASALYPHIIAVSEMLEKSGEQNPRKILIKSK